MTWSKIRQLLQQRWIQIALWLLLGLPTIAFVAVSLAIAIYIYWPANYGGLVTPQLPQDSQHAIVIAHGVRDTPSTWSEPLRQTLLQTEIHSSVLALDWRPWSSSVMRCSVDGLRIGLELGRQLANASNIGSLHAIGHSCGSFVVLGLCRGLRETRPNIQVQSTYLDPVSIYGGLWWNYGVTHFGECADFSEVYFDTQDGVPGSNQPLPNAHSIDVTAARISSTSNLPPHVWPTAYYQLLVQSGTHPDLRKQQNLSKTMPSGASQQIEEVPDG